MPDKAIDILDEAGAMRKLENVVQPPEVADIEAEIVQLTEEKGAMVSAQDYERAAEVRDRVRNLKARLESVRIAWERASRNERALVDEGDIRRVVAEATGIPLMHLAEQESRRLLMIEAELHRAVIGQDDAVRRIASSIRRSRAGVSSPRRPMGSFIFLGPTGVGKTLLAKRLSEYLFGSEESLVRIDMSDFMEKHNASRLIGAPPGYIGYEEGGVLTEKIRRNPYRVVLFDEIEKAHRDVFNLLLQVMEEGELRDNLGHTVNFRNTVIIMTSNAGVREISRDSRLGFGTGSGILSMSEIESQALSELRRLFNPEFLNRVDDVVVFHPLDIKQIEAILDIEVGNCPGAWGNRDTVSGCFPRPARSSSKRAGTPNSGAGPCDGPSKRNWKIPWPS
jgi:ATP-dependent Clp protease ATP-binding subunit ClpC